MIGIARFKFSDRFLTLLLIVCFLIPAGQAIYIFDPNDPDSCPFEAEVGEPIIGLPGGEPGSLNFLNGAQNSIAEQLEGTDITKGEYIRTVYPELWASLSEDEKNTYNLEKMKWSSSKQDTLSFAVIGTFSSPPGSTFAETGSILSARFVPIQGIDTGFVPDHFSNTEISGYTRSVFSIQQNEVVAADGQVTNFAFTTQITSFMGSGCL